MLISTSVTAMPREVTVAISAIIKNGFWGTSQPLPTSFGIMISRRQTLRSWLLFVACGPGNIKGVEEEVEK